MRYLVLIYSDEQANARMTPEEQAANVDAWITYTADIEAAGKSLGGEALQPTATATTVRVKNGENLISDGPFAESKEQLGGYYLVDATDLDEAISWASRMPHMARGGAVEVRPLIEFDWVAAAQAQTARAGAR